MILSALAWATTKPEKRTTNQYRPLVGTAPSDDIPLKAKGGEKFPARSGGPRLSSHVEAAVGTGQTYKNIPSAVCQKFTISAVASEKTGRLIVPEPDGRKKKHTY